MASLIGPNAAIRYLKDYRGHLAYWKEVNPAVLLAYVDQKAHTPFIEDYAAQFPNSLVVGRVQHPIDGGFHLPPSKAEEGYYIASPVNYHNDYGHLGRIKNGVLNVFNEPDGKADSLTIQRLVDWFLEYIPLAVQSKTKSVLFNWGKKQPLNVNGMMDPRYASVLKLAAKYPELFYMGMHFYGPEPVTEELQAYIALCAQIGITPLQVIGTEWGNDNRVGGGIEAAWEISQTQHELAPFIQSGVLIGFNRFQEGNSGGWEGYATENDKPYKDEIRRAAKAGEINAPDRKRITWTIPVVKVDPEQPPAPVEIPVIPAKPEPNGAGQHPTPAQITKLEAWRDELTAEISKLSDRKTMIETWINLAKEVTI